MYCEYPGKNDLYFIRGARMRGHREHSIYVAIVMVEEQRKFIDSKKTKLFHSRWNWDEEIKLRGVCLQIYSPPPLESSPPPVPPFV
jgi:hypothetical protein